MPLLPRILCEMTRLKAALPARESPAEYVVQETKTNEFATTTENKRNHELSNSPTPVLRRFSNANLCKKWAASYFGGFVTRREINVPAGQMIAKSDKHHGSASSWDYRHFTS